MAESCSEEYASSQLELYQKAVEYIKTRPQLIVGQGLDVERFQTSMDWCQSADSKRLP